MPIIRCKVCVIGDSKVGKSALVQMFQSNGATYPKNYLMTLGADIVSKIVKIPDSPNSVELFMFDSSGSNLYASQRATLWADSDAVVIVYDVSNAESFRNCQKWLDEYCRANPTAAIRGVLVGTKNDLSEYAEVKQEDAQEFASEIGLGFFTCSALESRDIDAPFNYIAAATEHLANSRGPNS